MITRIRYMLSRIRFAAIAFGIMLILISASSALIFAHGGSPETDTWTKDATVEKVTFYHKIITCNNQTVVLLKFENSNKKKMHISWNESYVTLQDAAKVQALAGKKQLVILSGITTSAGCEDDTCKDCKVLPQIAIPTHKADITRFEFKDIEVTTASL